MNYYKKNGGLIASTTKMDLPEIPESEWAAAMQALEEAAAAGPPPAPEPEPAELQLQIQALQRAVLES